MYIRRYSSCFFEKLDYFKSILNAVESETRKNAVKHSQDSQMASYINIVFRVEKGRLYFTCENSLPSSSINNQTGGLGLANVKRRLDLLYKNHYSLEYKRGSAKYIVKLELKL